MKFFKTIFIASIGSGLEFFDFTIYALFAGYIGQNFFPADAGDLVALVKTFSIFALGYLVRPLGGIVWGHLGDQFGRKFPFSLSILLMAVATFFIGLLPTYSQIGSTATILLVLLRLLQGFAMGGEIAGSVVFITEHYENRYPGFAIGCIFMSLTLGNALASLLGFILTKGLSSAAMNSWGWRIPFIFGCVLALVGLWLRRETKETAVFLALKQENRIVKKPLLQLIQQHKTTMLLGMGYTVMIAALVSFLLFLPTYLNQFLGYESSTAYLSSTLCFLLLGLLCPFFGWCTDKIGIKPFFLSGALLFIVLGYWSFEQLIHHRSLMPWLFCIIIAVSAAMINCTYALLIARLFPPEIRYSGFGFCFNLGYGLVGGLTPLLLTLGLTSTNNLLMPYCYLLICTLISLVVECRTIFNRASITHARECT